MVTEKDLEGISKGDWVIVTHVQGRNEFPKTEAFYFIELAGFSDHSDRIMVAKYESDVYTNILLLDKIQKITRYIPSEK